MNNFKSLASVISLIFFFSLSSFAQNASRIFKDLNVNEERIRVIVSDGYYEIIPYNNHKAVHTTFYSEDREEKNYSFALDNPSDKLNYRIVREENKIVLLSTGIEIAIIQKPFQIQYFYQDKKLIEEKHGYSHTDSTLNVNFNITKDEILYGGGARVLGMDRRGNKLQLYNRAHYGYTTRSELMNYTLPVFVSPNPPRSLCM